MYYCKFLQAYLISTSRASIQEIEKCKLHVYHPYDHQDWMDGVRRAVDLCSGSKDSVEKEHEHTRRGKVHEIEALADLVEGKGH